MSFCVLANIPDSIDDADFAKLLVDVSTQFGPDRETYCVHRDPRRAIEFSCDDAAHKVVHAWLQARPEVADVRVDAVEDPVVMAD